MDEKPLIIVCRISRDWHSAVRQLAPALTLRKAMRKTWQLRSLNSPACLLLRLRTNSRRLPPTTPLWKHQVRLKQRSEEHKSELKSLMRNTYAVFCFKKTTITQLTHKN